MAVIALTQGMGSLAQDIAKQLADELGLATLQHEVGERVADKMHVSKSLINRLRAGKAGTFERLLRTHLVAHERHVADDGPEGRAAEARRGGCARTGRMP